MATGKSVEALATCMEAYNAMGVTSDMPRMQLRSVELEI